MPLSEVSQRLNELQIEIYKIYRIYLVFGVYSVNLGVVPAWQICSHALVVCVDFMRFL
ncbi:hypothetical protein [Campylobacter concisus]